MVYHLSDGPDGKGAATGNYVRQMLPELWDEAVKLELACPLQRFWTASQRMGSAPSDTIDLYGLGTEAGMVRYAQVRL